MLHYSLKTKREHDISIEQTITGWFIVDVRHGTEVVHEMRFDCLSDAKQYRKNYFKSI